MTGLAGQKVTCRGCGRTYRCTPAEDYYNATTSTDGQCEACLTAEHGLPDVRTLIITRVVPGRREGDT